VAWCWTPSAGTVLVDPSLAYGCTDTESVVLVGWVGRNGSLVDSLWDDTPRQEPWSVARQGSESHGFRISPGSPVFLMAFHSVVLRKLVPLLAPPEAVQPPFVWIAIATSEAADATGDPELPPVVSTE
jgi:hypothetical protein